MPSPLGLSTSPPQSSAGGLLHNHNHSRHHMTSKRPTHSHLLTSGARQILNFSGIRHPQQTFTARLREAEQVTGTVKRPVVRRRYTS